LSSGQARVQGLLAAELDRDPDAPALAKLLAGPDSAARERAALSLARIGGTRAAEQFATWLGDGTKPMSAAMLGATAALAPPEAATGEPAEPAGVWAAIERSLWSRYALSDSADEAEALLVAIARLGGRTSVRNLGVDLQEMGDDSGRRFERAAEALAILCVRRHSMTVGAVEALAAGLAAEQVAPRRGSAYALSRCAGPSAERLAGPERAVLVERLSAMVIAEDSTEALEAWRALEALGEPPETIPEAVLGKSPPSWQVEVAAVRALSASAAGRKALSERLALVSPWDFGGERVHVLLETFRGSRRAVEGTPELLEPFAALGDRIAGGLAGMTDPRRKKELGLVHCEYTVLQAVRKGDLAAVRSCAEGVPGVPPQYGEVLAIDALLAMGSAVPQAERIDQLLAAAASGDKVVAVAGLSALAEIEDPRVSAVLRTAMAGDDVGLVSAAAGSIAARAVDHSKRDEAAIPVLRAAIKRLQNATAVEGRIEAIRALTSLARSAKPDKPATDGSPADVVWLDDIVALAKDPNQGVRAVARAGLRGWPERVAAFDAAVPSAFVKGFSPAVHAALDSGATATGLVVHTAAGDLTIDFAGAPSPIAQSNLAALAADGYFDGLTFHRVVPAFVVQGGDPRGDGYGGPGHVMPCEWSNLRYERGTVGVALAGKDTGGSQIFISHGAPHHLDGRYPVVGRVVEGLDVVDRILPFDTITSVDVVRAE